MATAVIMPALGESVTEGTVTTWLKSVGDTVPKTKPSRSALSWPSSVMLPRPRKTLLPPHRKAHPPRRPLPRHNPHPLLPLLRRPRHR